MTKVAVVEHPSHRLESMSRQLEGAGLDVMPFMYCELLLKYLPQMHPDIVVMSAVPEEGPQLCWNLVEQSHVPIVAILRQDDAISGPEMLESGADACLTEPISTRELIARMNALLRRKQSTPPEAA